MQIGLNMKTNKPYELTISKFHVSNRLCIAKEIIGLFDRELKYDDFILLFSNGHKKIAAPPVNHIEIDRASLYISVKSEAVKITTTDFVVDGVLLLSSSFSLLHGQRYYCPERYRIGQLLRAETTFFVQI